MCFTQSMSAAFALLGYLSAFICWKASRNAECTKAIAFFSLMETLQAVQYSFIADDLEDARCLTFANQLLTFLGYLHIQFQPYFTNMFFKSFRPALGKSKPGEEFAWAVVMKLCLVQCGLGLLRLALGPGLDGSRLTADERDHYRVSKDWLDGPKLCTYHGAFHLAWSMPLAQPTYFLGGLGVHCFMMFAPALCIGGWGEVDAVAFLVLTGPVMASFVSSNLQEQASIWCFFSMLQCAIGASSAVLQSRAVAAKTKAGARKTPAPAAKKGKAK
ncbi:hypothetical protein M885DRAFT_587070 [Pelagophyceae sp. CCMP2097]|nr:hypothetical protein M885DRAFT_587070 [Pelagophyceae sp. CCMP2097]|mmetsp:Transcript_29027/g.100013  ORF Transcript_29027/g.100013 Transcript_29027/m.100013 type:complete len:273 (+) Transcript_29027:74-892(+)